MSDPSQWTPPQGLPAASVVTTPAGWYPDPTGTPGLVRYWTGTEWSGEPRRGNKHGRPLDVWGIISLVLYLGIPLGATFIGMFDHLIDSSTSASVASAIFIAYGVVLLVVAIIATVKASKGRYSSVLGTISLVMWAVIALPLMLFLGFVFLLAFTGV